MSVRPPQAARHLPVRIIELRNNRLRPSVRDAFIDYFEEHFLEGGSQHPLHGSFQSRGARNLPAARIV